MPKKSLKISAVLAATALGGGLLVSATNAHADQLNPLRCAKDAFTNREYVQFTNPIDSTQRGGGQALNCFANAGTYNTNMLNIDLVSTGNNNVRITWHPYRGSGDRHTSLGKWQRYQFERVATVTQVQIY